jgi:tRNA threonylcarbamoyladenosine biosynthesis protein TsaE
MPILDERSLELLSHSAEQTRRLGVRLGEMLAAGDLVCLSGDLGSGKTTLTQGIARGWGTFDAVTSPTFVLINQYRRADGQNLLHFDAFRISDPAEAINLGLSDLLEGEAPMVIEWSERVSSLLPGERLQVKLGWAGDERRNIIMTAIGLHYERMLRAFRQIAYGV